MNGNRKFISAFQKSADEIVSAVQKDLPKLCENEKKHGFPLRVDIRNDMRNYLYQDGDVLKVKVSK